LWDVGIATLSSFAIAVARKQQDEGADQLRHPDEIGGQRTATVAYDQCAATHYEQIKQRGKGGENERRDDAGCEISRTTEPMHQSSSE
jgi:hypothetical protein